MQNLILVGLGGFIGSILRYIISQFMQNAVSMAFPFGTLMVNVIGCFVIGLASVFVEKSGSGFLQLQLFISVGLIGGFTTFSAFGLETVTLLREQHFGMAGLYALLSLVLGIGAVFMGKWIL